MFIGRLYVIIPSPCELCLLFLEWDKEKKNLDLKITCVV